jgi:hypothetical protein
MSKVVHPFQIMVTGPGLCQCFSTRSVSRSARRRPAGLSTNILVSNRLPARAPTGCQNSVENITAQASVAQFAFLRKFQEVCQTGSGIVENSSNSSNEVTLVDQGDFGTPLDIRRDIRGRLDDMIIPVF